MRAGAYYTVEAVFVMTICIWVLMALCTGGLYIHDRVILVSEINEATAESMAETEQDAAAQVRKRLEEKMFFLRVESVTVKDRAWDRRVRVRYTFTTYPVLEKVWKGREHEASGSKRKPAEYRWDAEREDL